MLGQVLSVIQFVLGLPSLKWARENDTMKNLYLRKEKSDNRRLQNSSGAWGVNGRHSASQVKVWARGAKRGTLENSKPEKCMILSHTIVINLLCATMESSGGELRKAPWT